jgi:diphosphomevalonate decarboxylase
MCLDNPTVEVTVERSSELVINSFDVEGRKRELTMKNVQRFQKVIDLAQKYLTGLGVPDAIPKSLTITVRSAIPPSIGLASSAAVFSALAEAIGGLAEVNRPLTREEISIIARMGSGSAARSVFDGYVALTAGNGDGMDSAKAMPVAGLGHWTLCDIVLVPTKIEKEVGSTEGHSLATTSPLFPKRLQELPDRQKQAIDAIHRRDFELLKKVAEADCLDMHNVMRTSTPSLQYLSGTTNRIVDAIEVYRRMKNLPVFYTMDAGPTVHLICEEEAKEDILHFAHEQGNCAVYVAKTGPGSKRLERAHV